MKLDKRIINGKRPLTCFDVEEAETYIGKLCYMCDEYNQFYKLNLIEPTILKGVEDCEIPFHYGRDHQAEFCLPCDWVTKEKKYRPYKTICEFFEKENLETYSKIRIRNKNCQYDSQIVHIVGFGQKKIDDGYIEYLMLGCHEYSLENLFANYEFQFAYTDDFKPFGVEE